VDTECATDATFDTLLVGSEPDVRPSPSELISFLRGVLRKRGECFDLHRSFVLGEAGLLDGRRATTHWLYAKELQRRYPKVSVEVDRIFIADGQIWTSAGMTAGLDLALGLVERDIGREKVREAARLLVLHHRRAGGQSQHSALLDLDASSDRVQTALQFARRNLGTELSVDRLAEAACLSPRQFSRVFRTETGLSPAKAIENLRLEAARLMLEQGRLPIESVANETGFGDRSVCDAASSVHSARPRKRSGTRHVPWLPSESIIPGWSTPTRKWLGTARPRPVACCRMSVRKMRHQLPSRCFERVPISDIWQRWNGGEFAEIESGQRRVHHFSDRHN